MQLVVSRPMQNFPSAPLPRTVAWLGYGGLVPFVAGAAACWSGPTLAPWHPLQVLVAYGAVILSFVGALHWAFAMLLPQLSPGLRAWQFTWSTVPALVAWPAVLVAPRAGALLLVAGFIAHWLQDRRQARVQPLPAWYLPLRLQLTAVACLCLLAGAFA